MSSKPDPTPPAAPRRGHASRFAARSAAGRTCSAVRSSSPRSPHSVTRKRAGSHLPRPRARGAAGGESLSRARAGGPAESGWRIRAGGRDRCAPLDRAESLCWRGWDGERGRCRGGSGRREQRLAARGLLPRGDGQASGRRRHGHLLGRGQAVGSHGQRVLLGIDRPAPAAGLARAQDHERRHRGRHRPVRRQPPR